MLLFFPPNTTIRLMWPGLYVNEVGCYLHDTNKPTSTTEIMTIKNKTKTKDCQK